MSAGGELLAEALAYRSRGWSILPIRARKKPAVRTWKRYQSKPASVATVRRWFGKPGLHGLAVILGDVSGGTVCRDFDDADAYHRWAKAHPDLARTLPTAQTARGFHVYARCPGPGAKPATMPDGEFRAAGQYVVLPPSRHPSGIVYRWIVPLPPGELPTIDPEVCGLRTAPAGDGAADESLHEVGSRAGEDPHPPTGNGLCDPVSSCVSATLTVPVDDARVRSAIERTLPPGIKYRNTRLFTFLRHLKALPGVSDLGSGAIRPYVRAWHRAAKGRVGTPEWEVTWTDALHGWPRIRVPFGSGPLKPAVERARSKPDPRCAREYERPDVRLLVRLIRELHALREGGAVFLDCRSIGAAVGMDKMAAWRFLRMLCADGVLRMVRKGHTGRASEYLYLGD